MSGRQSIMINNQLEVGQWINILIQQDNMAGFYEHKSWRKLRREVLRVDKYECQLCKAKGYYTKATVCHHTNYLRLHPELALEKYYVDDDGLKKRNLISVCKFHHEEIHKSLMKEQPIPLTQERW